MEARLRQLRYVDGDGVVTPEELPEGEYHGFISHMWKFGGQARARLIVRTPHHAHAHRAHGTSHIPTFTFTFIRVHFFPPLWQDKARIFKQLACELVPGFHIFLDVDEYARDVSDPHTHGEVGHTLMRGVPLTLAASPVLARSRSSSPNHASSTFSARRRRHLI